MFFKRKSIASEEDLLRDYQQTGNMDSLGKLFENQIDWLFSVCYGLLRNQMDAEDMVVQVFEKLQKDLPKHEINNFRSWLHSLTRNECLMLLRKKQPDFKPLDEVFDLSIMDSDEKMHQENELKKLDDCIEKLKPEQKQTVKMFYMEEKCYAEISESLQMELKKVKSLLQNGRRMLKNCLEGN